MDLKEKILVECYLSQTGLSHNQMVKDRLNLEIKNNEHDYALSAMDELSKIVVIAFDIWRVNNGWIRCSNAKHQITYFGVNNRLEKITYTTEQLYELFTQSKEYQELMDAK